MESIYYIVLIQFCYKRSFLELSLFLSLSRHFNYFTLRKISVYFGAVEMGYKNKSAREKCSYSAEGRSIRYNLL